jgi:hypothetical protein
MAALDGSGVAAGPAAMERLGHDPVSLAILYTPMLGVTVFNKFAVPVGDKGVLLGVPLIIAATLVGLFTGRLVADRVRFPFYLLTVAVLCAQQAFAVDAFSLSSLILIVVLHSAYAFQLVGAGADPEPHLRRFRNLAMFICIAGIVQYFAQYVVGPRYAFPIEHLTPDAFVARYYNMMNPVRYGSPLFKSNGVFMAEPSYFSQLLAAGVVCETLGPRRLWRLAVFGMGFVVSYSGTGLLMLIAAAPVFVLAHRRYDLIAFFAGGVLVLLLFGEALGLDVFVERATEFRDPRSSAYTRYVGGLHLIDEYVFAEPRRWLFGFGAGMMFRATPARLMNVMETGWVKILVEFGLVGAALYFSFLYSSILRVRQPLVQRVAIGMSTLVSGLLDPGAHGMILTLLVWLPSQGPAVAKPAASNPHHSGFGPAVPLGGRA